ncbi:hypothetical protein GGP41_001109 [Bipolaris sorokiniana]|uniref:Uncharacterized protein n=1 Tax=Cochliobolus sativus TaxID=45130 RepID=A0A8H5ZBK8_COCSA|nr:hypothetical protein GGP41_001109 [Bipolaris sorokiniana]
MAHDSPSNALNPDAPAFSPSSSPSQQASNQHQWNFRVLQIPYIHEGTSHYSNNFPSSNLYPTDYSNLGLFSAFSSQMNQVEGIQNSFHGQRSATNGHGGVWQQQPTKDRAKKSKRNKRKKHGKCKGKKKGDANGDELGSDQINGDGAGGDDVNGDEANGGGSNGGEANGDGTRDGDTPSENEWKFEEEET